MVSTKGGKSGKQSYADRVLRAISQIQREHRRNAIHLASLKAQIRKNAQASREKLGPQWSTWVNKAVKKLEEEGIIAPADADGTIMVTLGGKKAIGAVAPMELDNLPSTPGHLHKQVSHHMSTRGVKRSRRSSFAVPDWADSISVSALRTPQSKRPRPSYASVAGPRRITLQMTKAELIAEVDALNKIREQMLLRETSPLTDIEDSEAKEEIIRLKEELRRRDVELESTQRELVEAKSQYQRDRRIPHDSAAAMTPEFMTGPVLDSSSPHDFSISGLTTRSRPPNPVTRTQSGSLISDVSKQPTPAPSTSGVQLEDNLDSYNHDGDYLEDAQDTGNNQRQRDDLLPTPAVSPIIPVCDLPGVDVERRVLEDTQNAADRTAQAVVNENHELEHSLNSFKEELRKAKEDLSNRDAQISTLQSRTVALERKISENLSATAAKDEEYKSIKRDLEASLTSTKENLERFVRERDESLNKLKVEQEKYLVQISELQRSVNEADEANAKYVEDIAKYRSELESTQFSISALHAENQTKSNEIVTLLEEKVVLNAELQKQRLSAANLQEELSSQLIKASELEDSSDRLHDAIEEKTLLSNKLYDLEQRNHFISEQLAASVRSNASSEDALKITIDGLRNELAQVQTQTAQLFEQLSNSQTEAEKLRDELHAKNLETTLLQETSDILSQKIDGLERQLKSVTEELAELSLWAEEAQIKTIELESALSDSSMEVAAVKLSLETSQDVAKALECSLEERTIDLKESQRERSRLEGGIANTKLDLERVNGQLAATKSDAQHSETRLRASESRVRELEAELAARCEKERATGEALSAAQKEHAAESDRQGAVILELNDALKASRAETARARSDLEAALGVHRELSENLCDRDRDLSEARTELDNERTSASVLERDLNLSRGAVRELESQLTELRSFKAADERTIERYKTVYAAVRGSIEEASTKLASVSTDA